MPRRLTAALIAVVAVLSLGPAPVEAATPQEGRLRQPVYGSSIHGDRYRNHADPSILRDNGVFYAYSTHQTGTYSRNISVATSRNLWDWTPSGLTPAPREVMPVPPAWARRLSEGGEFWAPSVIRAAGRYVLYFGAKHRAVSASRPGWCIGIATSNSPLGPFVPRATPFFCRVNSSSSSPASFSGAPAQDRGAIDPQAFRAPNGRLYLYFKALDNQRQLWGVRLTPNGLARSGPGYGFAPLMATARTWEYSNRLHFTVMENPAMVVSTNRAARRRYVLLYAGGEWQIPSNYGTGYLTCRTPLSGCVRITQGRPWLRSASGSAGPGGASTFTGPDGKPWIAYHTYRPGHVGDGWGRRLHVEPLSFRRTGPRLANRRPRGTVTGVSPGAGTVRLSGRADDPDTGRPVTVVIRENGIHRASPLTDSQGNWAKVLTGVSPGVHRYCAVATDDNGHRAGILGCVNVSVT